MRNNLTALLFLPFILCAQTTTTKADWKTFGKENYFIQYPNEWELNESGAMGTSFILFSSLESDKDQFRENVNLLIQDLSGHAIDLDKYTEISEGQIKTMITHSQLLLSKREKEGSEEYHHLLYTGDQGIFQLQFEQYYWVRDNKAFVLTFTCEQSKIKEYKETGAAILHSFRFKK